MTDPSGVSAPHHHAAAAAPEKHLAGEHRAHTTDPARQVSDAAHVGLHEEELVASKRTVEAGAVQIDTEVISEPRTLEVPVALEEVIVERHAVERRPAASPIGDRGESITVPVHKEEVTVEKQPVVYEEVELGKRAVREQQVVSDTVRKEVFDVDAERDAQAKVDGDPQPRR